MYTKGQLADSDGLNMPAAILPSVYAEEKDNW